MEVDTMSYNLSVNPNQYGNETVNQSSLDGVQNTNTKVSNTNDSVLLNATVTEDKSQDIPKLQHPKVGVTTPKDAHDLLGNIGNSITVLMGLLHKLMAEQRKQNSDLIAAQYQNEKEQNLAQANEMERAADKTFTMQIVSATVQGAVSIASTALSFASAAKQISAASKNLDSATKTAELNQKFVSASEKFNIDHKISSALEKGAAEKALKNFQFDAALNDASAGMEKAQAAKLDAFRLVSDAAGNMTKNFIDAFSNRENSLSQAEIKRLEAEAQDIMATIEKLKETQESVKDLQNKALETMDSILAGERDVIRKMSV